tara:strand:- start:421 stop:918 length:498 start_codon:yes stop_codon:yes gene_type:complete
MDIEEIYINLKVLQSLDKNQKLVSRGQYLNIEPVSIIPEAIRRWQRQDNRNETIKKINLIVNSAIEYIVKKENKRPNKGYDNKPIVKKPLNHDDYTHDNKEDDNILEDELFIVNNDNNKHNMKDYLGNALVGIKNLKETYATCSQTCARIDVIINKINHVLNDSK